MVKVFDFGGLFKRGFEKQVNLSQVVDRPVTLIVLGEMSAVKITSSMNRRVEVKGKTSLGGRVSLKIEEREKLGLTALVNARRAGIEISGPIRALVLRVSSSAIKIENVEVDYITCNAKSSAIKSVASLKKGGGLLAKLVTSSLKAELNPAENGEYWIEMDLSASAANIITPSNVAYRVEGVLPKIVKISKEKYLKEAPVVFTLRITTKSSSVSLS